MIEQHKDQKYVKALCTNDSLLIEEIYQKCAANCTAYVKGNSGSEKDAADVFQEALTEVFLQGNKLILKKSICNYLHVIYKRKWINKLNRRKNFVRILKDIGYISATSNSQNIKSKEEKMEKIFTSSFKKLDKKCQKILDLYKDGTSADKIAEKLGIKRNNVYKQKFNCLDKLKTCCEQHPDFKDLMQ